MTSSTSQQTQQSGVRVRFAPSPTGHLHIGGLRTALFNWLYAKHCGGTYMIRVEDTDVTRSKKEYMESQLASLAWAGVTHDGPIVIQSERMAEHRAMADALVAQGKAYRCYCPPQKEDGDTDQHYYKYDGRCRDLAPEQQPAQASYSIRFKIPSERTQVTFNDLVRDSITFDMDQLDDFIIVRSDGTPMYNFVVVLDDAFMGITHVIRGEEHISNTPKQLLLYEAFGYAAPAFAHLPMILGADGTKLSKRNAATSVLEYKREGYLPEALCNYLARLGWSHGDQEIFSHEELIRYFSLDQVGKKGAIFDPQKLAWMNSVYLKECSAEKLVAVMHEDVLFNTKEQLPLWSPQQIFALVELYKGRVKTVSELALTLKALYDGPKKYDEQSVAACISADTGRYMTALVEYLTAVQSFDHQQLAQGVKDLCKQLDIKLVALAQPIRIALTGISASPGVFELLECLGKEASIDRIKKLLLMLER